MKWFENIPDELKGLRQWVCAVSGSKVPLNAETGRPASSTDPSTWRDFESAVAGVEEDDADNIGFVFAGNGLVGIDLDHDVFDRFGLFTPFAAELLCECDSYAERSRSGRGVHIIVRGKLPFKGRNNGSGVEMYSAGRYFIMTGDVVYPAGIRENQTAIDKIVDRYFPEVRECRDGGSRIKAYNTPWSKPRAGAVPLRPEYPVIGTGGRNLSLASVAGSMHTAGYPREAIRKEVEYVNFNACKPPLEKWELEQIISSIMRYKR